MALSAMVSIAQTKKSLPSILSIIGELENGLNECEEN
jgi:hypothetical protein